MITSSANEQIKFIRKLRDKKYRSDSGLFYIEGIRIAVEAMQLPGRVQTLIVAPDLVKSQKVEEVISRASESNVQILEVSQSVFESISLKEGPQGMAALVRQKWDSIETVDWSHMGLWVGLDSVADPGNLGTILRTMDAVGGTGVMMIGTCTDPYDPSSIRASMGAIFSLRVIKLSVDELRDLKVEKNLVCVGTSDSAKEDYQAIVYPKDMILLMGSERQGLQQGLIDLCDQMVSIPMSGKSDSLNLAVATGVMLYEIHSQHRRGGKK